MRIKEYTLTNYRAFSGAQKFTFSDRFTVIAGINGRGKTAMLDGLAVLCSRFLPLVSQASGYRTIHKTDVYYNATTTKLEMKINCANIPIDFYVSYNTENLNTISKRLTSVVRNEVRMAYGDPKKANDAAPLAVYYTTDRAGFRLPKKLPVNIPSGQPAAYTGALFNRMVNFRDFMARYQNMIILENEERRQNTNYLGDRAIKAIDAALSKFLGGFTNLRVEINPLRLLIDKDGTPLDLTQLSDGERAFLAMICDLGRRLALANPELLNPLEGAGVVLIDELELHLHPKWQREVVEKLKNTFPNIQFIATTHSPFIVQSLRPGELINLDPDVFGDYANKSIEDIAENVMGVQLPQKSERYQQMMKAAEEYYRLLNRTDVGEISIEEAEQKLNALLTPFSDDPAFQALLKLERTTRNKGDENATR